MNLKRKNQPSKIKLPDAAGAYRSEQTDENRHTLNTTKEFISKYYRQDYLSEEDELMPFIMREAKQTFEKRIR